MEKREVLLSVSVKNASIARRILNATDATNALNASAAKKRLVDTKAGNYKKLMKTLLFIFHSQEGCRFCKPEEDEAACRERCNKGCNICKGKDGSGLESCKKLK